MSRWRATWAGLLALALTALGGAASALPDSESVAATSATSAHPGPATLSIEWAPPVPVVVIGVDNWTWDEVDLDESPYLARLLDGAALGSNVTRTARDLSCPIDGWLAITAGTRLADPLHEARPEGTRCRTLANEPIAENARVPNAESYFQAAKDQQYSAQPGSLAQWLTDSNLTARGIGPGAGIALMDQSGQSLGEVTARPDTPTALRNAIASIDATDLLVIDLTGYGIDGPDPAAARQMRDAHLEATASAVLGLAQYQDVTVLVTSLSDGDEGRQLTVAFQQRLAEGGTLMPGRDAAFLGSESTRQDRLVQTTDIFPTIAAWSESTIPVPPSLIGLPWQETSTELSLTGAVDVLKDDAVAADAQLTAAVIFHVLHKIMLVALAILVLGALAGQARARALGRPAPLTDSGRTTLTITAIVGAIAPAASYLTGLVPWWQTSLILRWVFFTMLLFAVTAAFTAITVRIARRRPGPFTVPTVVAVTTLAVIVWDLFITTRMSNRSPLGSNILDAGRFFGMNNTSFSLFLVAVVTLAIVWVRMLRNNPAGPDRRVAVLGGVVVIGLAAIAIDGSPSIGADLGGIPSLVLAIATLVLLVGGWRITWQRALLSGAIAAAAGIGIALLDYMRPAEQRTHLGRFIEQVFNGQLWTILQRKLSTNVIIAIAITAGLIVVSLVVIAGLGRMAKRTGHGGWREVARDAKSEVQLILRPMTHARWLLAASAVGLVVASVVNDSGLNIALMGGQVLAMFVIMWTMQAGEPTPSASAELSEPDQSLVQ